VTTPSSGASITLGQSIHDSAVVSGNATGGSPTGTVSFFVCTPAQLTSGACTTGGSQVGSAVTLTAGAGNTASADSAN
jgi:hypothetical protein